jgi:general secretion pathway protein K
MSCRLRQRGVALITVLLVMALVAVIAAEMMRRGAYLRAGFGGQLLSRQAWHYALGGEAFARQLLALDHQRGDGRDTLDEAWAQIEEAPFAIDNGAMTIEIRDLQGRFNLNNVVDAEGRARSEGVAQWRNLLQTLGVDTRYAAEWLDWVDADQQRSPDGAEDGDYAGYRTAGGFEADVSALLLLRSMRTEDYARLAPLVTTLPANTPVNVNTASAEVLRSLTPTLSAARAEQLVARQRGGGFESLEQFRQLAGIGADQLPDTQIALASNYFEVRVVVRFDGRWQRLRSVLHRSDNGTLSLISRERFAPDRSENETER